jgi:hypothetical protein
MEYFTSFIKFLNGESPSEKAKMSPVLPTHRNAGRTVIRTSTSSDEGEQEMAEVIIDCSADAEPMGEEEEEEEEAAAARWNTEEEFVAFVKQKIGKPNGCRVERQDLYFEMIATTEEEEEESFTKVWWLPVDHPYVAMILYTNSDSECDKKYNSYDSYRKVVLFEAQVIEVAIDTVWNLIQKNGSATGAHSGSTGVPSSAGGANSGPVDVYAAAVKNGGGSSGSNDKHFE